MELILLPSMFLNSYILRSTNCLSCLLDTLKLQNAFLRYYISVTRAPQGYPSAHATLFVGSGIAYTVVFTSSTTKVRTGGPIGIVRVQYGLKTVGPNGNIRGMGIRIAGVPAVFDVEDVVLPLPNVGEVLVKVPYGNGQPDPDRDVKNGTRPVRVRLELEDRERLELLVELVLLDLVELEEFAGGPVYG
jgi:hypothetical protein